MNDRERYARLLRWYPPTWRARYGDELAALLEDTHRTRAMSWRDRLSIVTSGTVERARGACLLGDSAGPDGRLRAGALLILCAWVPFMVAGGIFNQFAQQWDTATPRPDRWLPAGGFDAVFCAGVVGVVLVLAAALAVMPALVRLIREEGWASVRPTLLRAALAAGAGVAITAGIVVWAHHLDAAQRNGGVLGYRIVGLLAALAIIAVLGVVTSSAVSLARRLTLSERTLRLLGAMAVALTVLMVVITAGLLIWWGAVATYAPSFLGSGALSTSNVTPPPLLVAGGLMVIGLGAAAFGAFRVVRALHGRRQT